MDTGGAAQFGACALSRDDPGLFDSFVVSYIGILQEAIRRPAPETDPRVFGGLRRLARRAGKSHAVPQDLIGVHIAALAEIVKTKPDGVVRASIQGSRLLLVKLIGELALYYREQAMRGTAAE